MFSLKVGTNTERKPAVMKDVNDTIIDALNESEISIQGASVSLNGRVLQAKELDDTFADHGIKDDTEAMLIAVVKADSAA